MGALTVRISRSMHVMVDLKHARLNRLSTLIISNATIVYTKLANLL